MSIQFAASFAGAHCLITGGLGFIGSNLAIRLVDLGAIVTVVDALLPEHGGNLFNIEPVDGRVAVSHDDIRDRQAMDGLVSGQDYVFHLAGQMSHVASLSDPLPDIEHNIKGTAIVLEALRQRSPAARLVFTGTRGQYGAAATLPVNEEAPTNPKGIHEVSKLAAEKLVQVYHDVHGIRSVSLRLTNIYGPRGQMRHAHYGVANWFVRLVVDDQTIQVFGDGSILRDFLYVDDCVEAILAAAACEDASGEILNVGDSRPSSYRELAETLVRVAGSGRWELAPFTAERKAQEPGDFYSDISKIRRLLSWEPRTPLAEGLRKTVAFYRAHKEHYW